MQTNALIASSLVRENVQPGITNYVYRECDLLNWFMSKGRVLAIGAVSPNGAFPMGWNINHTTNSSFEVFVEGQAAPASGQQGYVRAQISPFYGRVVCAVSGHLLDQIRNGGTYDNAAQAELTNGTKNLYVGIEAQLAGSTQDRGIASIVDASGTYANIAAGTVTSHASLETPVAGALTLTVLETAFETLFQDPRNSTPTDILCRENQVNNYAALAGIGAGAVSNVRINIPANGDGRGMDWGVLNAPHSYNGAVFTKVRSLVNTEMYILDAGDAQDMCVVEVRPVTVDDFGKSDDSTRSQISWAGMPVIRNRRKQCKLTGLTA